MHYTQYWRIHQSPFISHPRSRLFTGGTVEEAIARVRFMVKNRSGLGLLVGPALVGKTFLLRHLSSRLQSANADRPTHVVYLSLQGLNTDSMLAKLIELFGRNECRYQNVNAMNRERRWTALEDTLRGVVAHSEQLVLLVDDLDNGSQEIFSILRRISGSMTQMTCVLGVQEDRLLDLPRALIDQCQLKISLPSWDLGQTADYFEYCMDLCKGRDSIFDAQAITRIQELACGLPYRINYFADLCLVAGALRRLDRISAEVVDQVGAELSVQNEFDVEMASYDPSEPM